MGKNIDDLIQKRRSIRVYKDIEVDDDILESLVSAASFAPSNSNRQGYYFTFIKNKAMILDLANLVEAMVDSKKEVLQKRHPYFFEYAKNFVHFRGAPVLMISYYTKPPSFSMQIFKEYGCQSIVSGDVFSIGLAIQNMLLKATDLGLGSCVMSGPLIAEDDIKLYLKTPSRYGLGPMVCFGYANEDLKRPRRKNFKKRFEIIDE
ncbi:MAG: hypothetical protein COB02_05995 [Candidatus Cloacimonadota bacterium]|nr:MAG: hypothetical protein COB02_12095 [Candidatus Cloacimonadota bacterium]PCJ20150.1 MAG: hypothetical protein COB02_05995 [Candidatus Cloacimonadota bacterium]